MNNRYLKGGDDRLVEEYPKFNEWLLDVICKLCSIRYRSFRLINCVQEHYDFIMEHHDEYKKYKDIYESGDGIIIEQR